MAFFSKAGGILRQTVSRQINSEVSASVPSIFQTIRCMSSSKLFIGGLSYGTDETSLREAFNKYGDVVDARVIMDRETGRSRGFGFVTYTSTEEASAAIQALDGQDLHGRMVKVNFATERARTPSFGGGGYGGGGGGYGGGGGGYGGGDGGYNGGYNGGGGYGGGGGGYGGGGGGYGGNNFGSVDNAGGGGYGGGGYTSGGGYGGNNAAAGGYDGGNQSFGASGGGIDNFPSSDAGAAAGSGFPSSGFSQAGDSMGGSYKDDNNDDDMPDNFANRRA